MLQKQLFLFPNYKSDIFHFASFPRSFSPVVSPHCNIPLCLPLCLQGRRLKREQLLTPVVSMGFRQRARARLRRQEHQDRSKKRIQIVTCPIIEQTFCHWLFVLTDPYLDDLGCEREKGHERGLREIHQLDPVWTLGSFWTLECKAKSLH